MAKPQKKWYLLAGQKTLHVGDVDELEKGGSSRSWMQCGAGNEGPRRGTFGGSS